MKGLKIKEAIIHYNENLPEDEEKMNQQKLAKLVMPDKEQGNAYTQLNKLANGKNDMVYIPVLKKLSKVFNIPIDDLIY